ncbi:hypothetical protein M0G43_03125 [Subsaxibacter sp. CAU 1640]|uniref:hypothetical protein n=1 Tax=Subsaxibacter sp. CAU 1640 TaxID=2933271 RepID=UPI0020066739|nr:hypothetical protein [Subsaxibacter sp. CAU 1640]MCK7589559.1 hypothetical protein [Subsaxibacter sp. CAU 1640]
MNLLKTAFRATAMFLMLLGCFTSNAQSKAISNTVTSFQEHPTFKLNEVNFQEWYAGINVGGTGFNVFLPNITNDENVVLENVYFRNLTGKLVKGKGMYSATLKNKSTDYTWKYPEKPADYPFDLGADECVISYKENGVTKYIKIASLSEKAGTYYENGPPSIYENTSNSAVATVDQD